MMDPEESKESHNYEVSNIYSRTVTGSVISLPVVKTAWGQFFLTPAASITNTIEEAEIYIPKARDKLFLAFKIISALFLFIICDLCLSINSLSISLFMTNIAEFFIHGSNLLDNAVVGYIVGALLSTLMQSEKIAVLLIITVVRVNVVSTKAALPAIMGSGMGSSLTCSLITLLYIRDRNFHRRTLAAASLHWFFHWCLILIFLPLETLTGFLYYLTKFIVDISLISPINMTQYSFTITYGLETLILQTTQEEWYVAIAAENTSKYNSFLRPCEIADPNCYFLFNVTMPDGVIGSLLVEISLAILLVSCTILKQLLGSFTYDHSMMKMETAMAKLNIKIKMGQFLALFVGTALSMVVQSDITIVVIVMQLVGNKLVPLQISYPLIIGAKVGTSIVLILQSLMSQVKYKEAVQLALCRFFFHIFGIVLYFLIPCCPLPLIFAYHFSNTVTRHPWLEHLSVLTFHIIIPLLIFLAATIGSLLFIIIVVPSFLLTFYVLLLCFMQFLCPYDLPEILRTWNFLPRPLRSLEVFDNCFRKCRQCWCCPSGKKDSINVSASIENVSQPLESQPGDSVSVVINRMVAHRPLPVMFQQAAAAGRTQVNTDQLISSRQNRVLKPGIHRSITNENQRIAPDGTTPDRRSRSSFISQKSGQSDEILSNADFRSAFLRPPRKSENPHPSVGRPLPARHDRPMKLSQHVGTQPNVSTGQPIRYSSRRAPNIVISPLPTPPPSETLSSSISEKGGSDLSVSLLSTQINKNAVLVQKKPRAK